MWKKLFFRFQYHVNGSESKKADGLSLVLFLLTDILARDSFNDIGFHKINLILFNKPFALKSFPFNHFNRHEVESEYWKS